MICPKCNGDTYVADTRIQKYGMRRRRECTYCGQRFTTVEIPMEEYETLKSLKYQSTNCKKILEDTKETITRLLECFEEG